MADTPSAWSDNATLAGIAGLATAVGAALKTVFDWRTDRGKIRQTSEDMVRDDLLRVMSDQRTEITALREELAAARRELREHMIASQRRLQACEDRAVKFQRELADIRASLQGNS